MRRAALIALALAATVAPAPAADAQQRFPRGFLWGTATAGFQVEAGAGRDADRNSDWWRFATDAKLARDDVVSGDRPDRGPGFWRRWPQDLDLASDRLSNNAIRLGIEWSRIFPRSTQDIETGDSVSRAELRRLDRRADRRAVARYRAILAGAKRRGLRVMLTLNHWTLPLWVHDPIAMRRAFANRGADDPIPSLPARAGWLGPRTATELRKYAAYVAWKLGPHVDLYATVNEPLVTASQGFASIPGVTGVKAPAVLNFRAAIRSIEQLGLANAAAYDAIKQHDRGARVGSVHNLVAWRPADPAKPEDAEAVRHADQIFNRTWLDIVVHGVYDLNANGTEEPGERKPRLRNKADFLGINHYSPGRVAKLPGPVSQAVPLFDFAPTTAFRGTGNPTGPPCPTTCTDFGWEIDPSGLREVLGTAKAYGKPIYLTENGIDDAEDDQRPGYLRAYLKALHQAITDDRVDVRGYFHWSLVDNFEWAEGFKARFGLYGYDRRTLRRIERPSARLFARIARANALAP